MKKCNAPDLLKNLLYFRNCNRKSKGGNLENGKNKIEEKYEESESDDDDDDDEDDNSVQNIQNNNNNNNEDA